MPLEKFSDFNQPAVILGSELFQTMSSCGVSAPIVESSVQSTGASSIYVGWGLKRALDVVIVLTVLLMIALIIPIVILALFVQDGSPILYRQLRIGLGGRKFSCLKFRSMARDADERLDHLLRTCSASRQEWAFSQKLRSDPRIHSVGAILRRSSLDELPQLFNVLRGDMSVVGPRPMMPEQAVLYGENFARYSSVRPGITGLWQVSGRSTLPFEQRVKLDSEYSRDVTFVGDVKILFKTVWVVIAGHGSC